MAVMEKPPLDENLLIHYGVLGMKWGKSRAKGSKVSIKNARARVAERKEKFKTQQNKVKAMKDGKAKVAKMKDLEKTKISNLKSKDRVLAARMTRGEKAGTLILGLVTGVGLLPAAAVVAGTSARSRRIEYKQNTAAYQNKA